jgi:hypothetical protein
LQNWHQDGFSRKHQEKSSHYPRKKDKSDISAYRARQKGNNKTILYGVYGTILFREQKGPFPGWLRPIGKVAILTQGVFRPGRGCWPSPWASLGDIRKNPASYASPGTPLFEVAPDMVFFSTLVKMVRPRGRAICVRLQKGLLEGLRRRA